MVVLYNWSIENTTGFRTGRHGVLALHVHWVCVTTYRRQVLTEAAHETLRALFAHICQECEARLIEAHGEDDHVHLRVEYPPKVALSKLGWLKGVSSRRLRQHHGEIAARDSQGVLWSSSYCAASCGGAPLSIIWKYIEDQRNTR